MATVATVYPHITKDPRVCSGRACVAGTRVRVMDIVALREEGLTPDQIAEEFPSLSGVTDVYAAFVYAADHKDELGADFAESERAAKDAETHEAELIRRRLPR
jgi:uncharacterized protein (DUF433 family)